MISICTQVKKRLVLLSYCFALPTTNSDLTTCIYREIFTPVFCFFPPSLLSASGFQCLKLSLFNLNCICANSRREETVRECRRAKNTRDENNFVYSSLIKDVCNYIACIKTKINFIKQVIMITICS